MKNSKIPFLFMFLIPCLLPLYAVTEEVSFVVVSDLHMAERDGIQHFSAFVKQINELNPKPDFVVITGDIHVKEFQKVFNELKPTIPFHIVFGNHEKREDRKIIAEMFPEDFKNTDFYSFCFKQVKCIVLCDASDSGDHIGHFESEGIRGQEQQAWLEQELNVDRKTYPFVFLFAHIPPSEDGKANKMHLSSNDQKALREIFRRYKPNAMFCGHLHKKIEFSIENVPVFIIPSLNWNYEKYPTGFYHVRVEKQQFHADFVPLDLSLTN